MISRPAAGFYTEELRRGGDRLGFDVVALDGRRGPLARIGHGGPQVGKYTVDVPSFEAIGVQALETGLCQQDTLLVIDELGKMEFLSSSFLTALERAMGRPNPVLGTILYRPHPLADRFRRAPEVKLIQVTATNRETLPAELATLLG